MAWERGGGGGFVGGREGDREELQQADLVGVRETRRLGGEGTKARMASPIKRERKGGGHLVNEIHGYGEQCEANITKK